MKKNLIQNKLFTITIVYAIIAASLILFAPYRLGFKEQIGIFLLSPERIGWYMAHPAVIASMLGDFLTQFCMNNAVAIAINVLLLMTAGLGLVKFVSLLRVERPLYLLILLPIILEGYFVTFPNYPTSATVGLMIAVWSTIVIGRCMDSKYSFLSTLLLPILFVIAGGHTVTTALMLLLLCLKRRSGVYPILSLASGVLITLVITRFYNITILQAFYCPTTLGYILPNPIIIAIQPLLIVSVLALSTFLLKNRYNALISYGLIVVCMLLPIFLYQNREMEYTVKVGTKAYINEWDEVRELSSQNLSNQYALYYRNLSFARDGMLPDELFSCQQNRASDGLFLKTGQGDNLFSIIYYTDALLEIGDISTATDCALLAQTVMPGNYSTRMLKRLAEISITSGDYMVAAKYLNILSRTLMHRGWAREMERCIACDSLPEHYLIWRARASAKDHFFVQGDIRSSIKNIVQENPFNKVAADYLLCSLLLEKRLNTFIEYYDKYYLNALDKVVAVPDIYQEALLMSVNSEESLERAVERYGIRGDVVDKYFRFLKTQNPETGTVTLTKEIERTFWGYITSVKLN